MRTRRIGTLEVSTIGLGCNNFGGRIDFDHSAAVVSAALDNGITFVDTADIYGGTKSEEFLGRSLGRRRDEVVLATKFGMKVDEDRHGAKPDYVRRGSGGQPPSARHRPDRPLHPPRPRRRDPDRRHPGRSGRLRQGGEGAGDRLLELLGGAAA